jgi:enoyl-[acyl-carrier protein] reductase III
MIDLQGRVALVTGSSRGIGRACALRLAQAGADVILNYLTSKRGAMEAAEEISAMGRRAAVVKADVSEPSDLRRMVRFAEKEFGRLDILVSNVATGGFRPILDNTPRQWSHAMRSNVGALLALVRAAQPLLIRNGRGKVIALSGLGSRRAHADYGLIGATKASLESAIRQLAFELGPLGINFNVLLAGLVDTASTRGLPDAEGAFRDAASRSLAGRALIASDVADGVLFLASPLSDMVQGQVLILDAGAAIRS